MLITRLKNKDEINALIGSKILIVSCEGCKEVYFPEDDVAELQSELTASGVSMAVIETDYICNPDNLDLQLEKYRRPIDAADTILVCSCGVGASTVANRFPCKKVVAACDTLPLPGFQGVTPLEYDCALCTECHLNDTGGICPITACSKSLVNGQCGGAGGGKCEVDSEMDCGWERIYRRLEKLDRLDALACQIKIRDFKGGLA